MQLKTSYAAQVTAMRKERDAAQKDRDSALTELADMKARLAAASCEIDMLKDSKRSMEDEVRSVRSELTARSLSEADRHAVNEREKLFAAMLGDFSHVASQYLPSLLAHPLSKNSEMEADRSTTSEVDSSTKKVGALL
jgi:predicted  nucleic acid-binding Zn-ribbon protein